MLNNNSTLKTNTASLQELLNAVNNLPEASNGVELPDLTNEGTASDLLEGKELIDNEGNVVTGTFTIDEEMSIQTDLLAQIEVALEGKVGGGSSAPTLQDKTVTPTTSVQNVTPDSGYDGLSKVTVNAIPSTYIQPSGTKTVTTNGTHDVKSYASVSVNVASTGEDVTAETNEYTEKITQLTTAVTALENELAGKASGGSGNIATSIVTITTDVYTGPGTGEGSIHYTNSNGEYVEEDISLQSSGPVTINVAANTMFFTAATDMSSECQVNGGQSIEMPGGFLCVITDPTATIYLA
jgi:hypothetical protein